MFDLDAIMKRAQSAQQKASEELKKSTEEAEALTEKLSEPAPRQTEEDAAARAEELTAANNQRQVEILGQIFSEDVMAQMAANQQHIQEMVDQRVAEASSAALDSVGMLNQLFGEDLGVLSAAMETLAMEEEDGEEEEEPEMDARWEAQTYALLEETMDRIGKLPEPEPVPYGKDTDRWQRFGILLSGIVSTINDHSLEGMDVEAHIPVLEQQVVSIVRRSWGIDGRSDLLDMIRYLSGEGYILRYHLYSQADSPEELMDGDEDEEDRENIARAWRFAQRYKEQYPPQFMAGWDIGRAAMLTRWGCYLGWITQGEAVGILWELSQKAAEELYSWREFAQSYLFGGTMWKLLCGDSAVASYLGYLADAATSLIVGKGDEEGGQWRDFPWPARRKIGFAP